MSDKAILTVIKNPTKEHTALLRRHNELMAIHIRTVNDCADLSILCGNLKKENKALRELLDQCQRDLLESKGSVQELLDSIINEHDSFDFEGEMEK